MRMVNQNIILALLLAAASMMPSEAGFVLEDQSPGNHGNAGMDPGSFRCKLDPKLTEKDLPFFIPDIQGTWGSACGRNRGVFVVKPPDGHTYDCGNMPVDWGVSNAADITDLTKTQPAVALKAYGNFVDAVYNTTIGKTAEACDFDGLTVLTCGREEPWRTAPWYDQLKAPIRAVNIGGLFVLERWILPTFTSWGDESGIRDQHSFSDKCGELGTCEQLKDHWKNWYTPQDFKDMKKVGLNSIRLPVGWWYFAAKTTMSAAPYIVPDEDLYDAHHPITDVIRWAKIAGLYVILDLHGAPGSQNGLDNSGLTSPDPNEIVWGETWMYSPENNGNTVRILAAMAEYINHIEDSFGLDNIMALELLNEPWAHLDLGRVRDFYVTSITAVRLVRPLMPIIIHDSFRGPMWATLMKNFPYKDIVMDTHIYHGFNPADLSSDTAEGDRQKMYVHERMACSYTSMLRYQTCAVLPVMVGEWSLAVDNCMPWLDSKFADFGQCDHLTEREESSWWSEHTRSFAMRQIDRYEREMGWAFWTWKLEDHLEKNEPASKYWSFSMAVEHGFIDTDFPEDACIHPPATDWAKPLGTDGGGSGGDANLAAAQAPSGVTARVDGNAAAAVGVSNSPEETKRGSQKGASSPGAMLGLVLLGAMSGALATFLLVRRKAASQGASASASDGAEKGGGNRGGGWMPAVFRSGYDTIGQQSLP